MMKLRCRIFSHHYFPALKGAGRGLISSSLPTLNKLRGEFEFRKQTSAKGKLIFAQKQNRCCEKLFFQDTKSKSNLTVYFCSGQAFYDQLLLNSPRVGRQQG